MPELRYLKIMWTSSDKLHQIEADCYVDTIPRIGEELTLYLVRKHDLDLEITGKITRIKHFAENQPRIQQDITIFVQEE